MQLRGKDKVSLAVAVGLGVILSLALNLWPAPPRDLGRSEILRAVLADVGSPSVGPRDAGVTVIVFSDYQCAICRANAPVVEKVRREFPSVRFVYKDWPIFGERSAYAASVALAADRQGRFLALHDALMRASGPLDQATVKRVAEGVGINWPATTEVLRRDAPAIATQLKRHAFEAWSLGIAGTPAYLVGDKLYEGRIGERTLRKAIQRLKP